VIVAIAWLLMVTSSTACLVVGFGVPDVSILDEAAVIVWDSKNKVQHFIRSANFVSEDQEFGFIVPTPSKPELAEADDEIFARMLSHIAPPVEARNRNKYVFSLLLQWRDFKRAFTKAGMAMAGSAMPEPVRVLESKRVGGFDTVVLEADNAAALLEWLAKHGYDARPELESWLEPYVQRKWKLTAFKYVREQTSSSIETKPVRMSFATETPFYPYREPRDSRVGEDRSLHVFFVSDQRVEANLKSDEISAAWNAKIEFAGRLQAHNAVQILGSWSLENIPSNPWVTVFEDRATARQPVDLYFSSSRDQSQILPPPKIIWRDNYRVMPIEIILLVGGSLYLVVRSLRWVFRKWANPRRTAQ